MKKLVCIFIVIAAAGFFLPYWLYDQFGSVDISAILFHLQMPTSDALADWTRGLGLCLIEIVLASTLLGIFFYTARSRRRKILFWLVLISVLGWDIYNLQIIGYLRARITNSAFIEQNYVSPSNVSITAPTQNLIMIQVESLESSLQDRASGGLFDVNYIESLTQLAREHVSFSHSGLFEGAVVLPETGWTMGALVSETAALPLKAYKIHTSSDQIGNDFDQYTSFLAGVTTLGDILHDFGYRNYFILGSNKDFAGQSKYMQQHGNYIIYEKKDIIDQFPHISENKGWWGVYDKDLYAFVKLKLYEITQNPQPFSMIIQTIDSHREGILEPDCSSIYPSQIENVYVCVDKHLNKFITWLRAQPFAATTTIVVIGDHCNMSTGLFKQTVNKKIGLYQGTERKVFNLFINSAITPAQEKNRQFSTMDIFPTTLAAMGAQIAGDRLGLGTNLFSQEPTLPEKYGYDLLFNELPKYSSFDNKELLYKEP